jgi:hypothetical protein
MTEEEEIFINSMKEIVLKDFVKLTKENKKYSKVNPIGEVFEELNYKYREITEDLSYVLNERSLPSDDRSEEFNFERHNPKSKRSTRSYLLFGEKIPEEDNNEEDQDTIPTGKFSRSRSRDLFDEKVETGKFSRSRDLFGEESFSASSGNFFGEKASASASASTSASRSLFDEMKVSDDKSFQYPKFSKRDEDEDEDNFPKFNSRRSSSSKTRSGIDMSNRFNFSTNSQISYENPFSSGKFSLNDDDDDFEPYNPELFK